MLRDAFSYKRTMGFVISTSAGVMCWPIIPNPEVVSECRVTFSTGAGLKLLQCTRPVPCISLLLSFCA